MCGICGYLRFGDAPAAGDVVAAMAETLRHRGPDDLGVEVTGPVALGQTRLSIIDLTDAGHQPMFSDDRNLLIAYNGEVYNYLELRSRLESLGVAFHGRSDTEVVLKAYQQWGTDAFPMFNGMFAVAIWDATRSTLCLARDRFGIKPLYYSVVEDGLVFASEIKAILAATRSKPSINWCSLHEYLYHGHTIAPRTMFDGVHKLLPGHCLTVKQDGQTIDRAYWTLADPQAIQDDLETATSRVETLFRESVQRHLISDVPVGVFLSGGIDSGSIAAMASRHYGGALHSYSVGFDFDPGGKDELPLARYVAEQCGTEHHEIHVAGDNIERVIQSLVRSHDEPFADAANIPLYLLCEQLQGSVKVVLQGDGGDEIFGGYPWRFSQVMRPQLWRALSLVGAPFLRFLPQNEFRRRVERLATIASQPTRGKRLGAMLARHSSLSAPPTAVLAPAALEQVLKSDPYARYEELDRLLGHLEPCDQLLRTDCAVSLPDQFLEKVDKSTMAHGIEVRVPMLDAELAEYCLGLPVDWKYRQGEKKWLFRRAMRGITPDRVLDGKKKGFDVPVRHWLRTSLAPFMRSVLLDRRGVDEVFDSAVLSRYVEEHISGERDRGMLLYRLLNFALWRETYLG